MGALTKELFFRFMYSAVCLIALSGVYYFSYGWQCEYASAHFRYHQQSLDYCYDESLLKFEDPNTLEANNDTSSNMCRSKTHITMAHGAQCWNDLFLNHSAYFYGIDLHNSINSLLLIFVLSHALGWLLFCVHGWVCEGQINGRLTRQCMFIWATGHSIIISSYLAPLSLYKELSIETLDSELINHFNF